MRKKERIYLYVFLGLFLAYVATDFMAPKPVDWRVTFQPKDKNPFGGFILNERAIDLFEDGVKLSTGTISDLSSEKNLMILAERAEIAGNDVKELFNILENGGHVWIGSNSYSTNLEDTLGVKLNTSYQMLNQDILEAPESTLTLFDSANYAYPSTLVTNYFELENEEAWKILATVDLSLIHI